MPLPMTDLDTRRWDDLVDVGRGLIPRYAPDWTDHNIHDPGITLIELLAWLTEQDIYRVNRVPARHYRKFLHLIGFGPEPPMPARVPLTFAFAPGEAAQTLPAGVSFATGGSTPPLQFRTLAPLTVVPAGIVSLFVYDGVELVDRTRQWRERLPVDLFGVDPPPSGSADQAAFYIGFDQPLPPDVPVSLWLQFTSGGVDWEERDRIIVEAREEAAACVPVRPQATCPPAEPSDDIWCPDVDAPREQREPAGENDLPAHHTVRLAWDYYGQDGWQQLDPEGGEVRDGTRGLTLDGPVVIRVPGAIAPLAVGDAPPDYFYLRCRLVAGRPDSTPSAQLIAVNSVAAEQASAVRSSFVIRPDAVLPPAGDLERGQRAGLRLWFDAEGAIERIEVDDTGEVPSVFVVDYQAAAGVPGHIEVAAAYLGRGAGLPEQWVSLPAAPVSQAGIEVWSQLDDVTLRWRRRPDLDASKRDDAHFVLDATDGRLAFGNGDRGRTVPPGASIFASYDVTAGDAGNIPATTDWRLDEADRALNLALLDEDPDAVFARLSSVASVLPATGGADEEDIRHAAGRAAEMLWAHERLLEICPPGRCDKLDGLDSATVWSRTAPPRAVTLLDYERLSLDVPGTRVRRARAWAGIDPAYPCFQASGVVTVVIVPELPAGRPQPGAALVGRVQQYLERRRTIGTRLVVVGPQYLEVRVQATVRIMPWADEARVEGEIGDALDRFLDPLIGGPAGRGWPFGRDVHRSEILQTIDATSGVDHVLSLSLTGIPGEEQCGNVCVPPTWLVTPGPHTIEVVR